MRFSDEKMQVFGFEHIASEMAPPPAFIVVKYSMPMRFIVENNEGNARPQNVRWFFDLATMASASWQVYHTAACDARKTHDLSSDFHFSGQGGACIQHTTW